MTTSTTKSEDLNTNNSPSVNELGQLENLNIHQNDFVDLMKAAKEAESMERILAIKPQYFNFLENKTSKGAFFKFGTTKNAKGTEDIPAIFWVSNNTIYCSAAKMLHDDCKEANLKKGDKVEFEFLGKKPGSNIYNFKVHALGVRPNPQAGEQPKK